MYIDCHCHWTDLRLSPEEKKVLIEKALSKNITGFMCGGVDPEEWQRQKELTKNFPGTFYFSFGVHPYFVAQNDLSECEGALDQLAREVQNCHGIGETGLDFRDQWLAETPYEQKAKQIQIFESHLEISEFSGKPLVLHIVKAHEEALKLMKHRSKGSGGFIHAYNGSWELAQSYLDLGFLISIGGAVTSEKNQKLQKTVRSLPLDFLLIETDSPDQPLEGSLFPNDSSRLVLIAEKIGQIKGISADDVLAISTNNFKRLFSL